MLVIIAFGCSEAGTEALPTPPTQANESPGTPATSQEPAPAEPQDQAATPETPQKDVAAEQGDDDSGSTTANEPAGAAETADAGDSKATPEGQGSAESTGPKAVGSATVELACSDQLDNDGDRATDCDDTDCWSSSECEDAEGPAEGDSEGDSNDAPPEFAEGEGPFGPGPPGGPGPPPGGWTEPAPEGQRGPGGKPEGKGVACQDYMDCVCAVAMRAKGEQVAGYDHADTCRIARSYTGNSMEEQCGNDLDNFKNALHDAQEIYKAKGIKIPAACQ